jgi:hypothetical protein
VLWHIAGLVSAAAGLVSAAAGLVSAAACFSFSEMLSGKVK